jgi:hypothetical protein
MSYTDDDVLMAFPGLYRYGRERTWFSMRLFLIYMLDGVIVVCFLGLYQPPDIHAICSIILYHGEFLSPLPVI